MFGSFTGGSRNIQNTVRKNRVYQLAAANMFYGWAEALSTKLDMIIANSDSVDMAHGILKKDPTAGFVDLTIDDFFNESKIQYFNFEFGSMGYNLKI
jgi:hypothetical protein